MFCHIYYWVLLFFWISITMSYAQGVEKKILTIERTDTSIILDGNLDDEAWKISKVYSGFKQYFPYDTSYAVNDTEIRLSYDKDFVYLSAKVYEVITGNYVSVSLRRDFTDESTDGIGLVLDTFKDGTNGFFFGITPYGVQREGLISNGGVQVSDIDFSWDNKWFSYVKIYDAFWVAEIAIPFKTLRFNEGASIWGINVFRVDSKLNERSTLTPVPRQFQLSNLAFLSSLTWDKPLRKTSNNISVIPYIAANSSKAYLAESNLESDVSLGGDIKIAVSPSLNLDLTINPDFSQVEVDQQQTNLDRFELFFPERRQFFLENADLFSSFGLSNARPFFSRRIGVAIDSASGQNIQNQIIAGARLSGKIDKNWRIGIMSMQTAKDNLLNIPSLNYSVAVVQRKLFTRSNISAIYVNKSNFENLPIDVYNPALGNFSRLIGLDYNLASPDGKWIGKAYYHHSFNKLNNSNPISHGATLLFNTLKFNASWTHQFVGEDFETSVGFLPRNDFKRINPVLGYNIFPKSNWINQHVLQLSNNFLWNNTWGITDYNFSTSWTTVFQSTARYNFSILSNYVKLFTPFNPTGNQEQLFQPGESFSQTGFLSSFQSDTRKKFNYFLQVICGGFYNGNLKQLSGSISYRFKQYAAFSLTYNINKIDLAEGYDDANLVLLGQRVDVTFTKSLFWTTFTQYNSQFRNLNINSRLQWRFKPASDFFLVYTENYFPENLKVKNRAIVAKLTYWINF